MEKILGLENNRNRYLCSCQTMFETRKYYVNKYLCRGCHPNYDSSDERLYINILRGLGLGEILQQYSHSNLLGVNDRRLRYDIALLHEKVDKLPFFLIKILSSSDFIKSNQDGSRDNYITKVLFARDFFKIPMLECGPFVHDPQQTFNEAMEKFNEIKQINNLEQYHTALCKSFYEPIVNRIGEHHFEEYFKNRLSASL